MVRHLLREFLSSGEEYEQSVALWRSLLRELSTRAGQAGEWVDWRPATFVDGTPIPRDGNPIIDARNARLSKAITVMQHPAGKSDLEFAAWIADRQFEDVSGQRYTDDLTLNLALSEEALQMARVLIERWMDPGISRERMEDLIEELAPSS